MLKSERFSGTLLWCGLLRSGAYTHQTTRHRQALILRSLHRKPSCLIHNYSRSAAEIESSSGIMMRVTDPNG
jgi:hypothetical protein